MYPGRTECEPDTGDLELIALTGSVTLLGNGSGSMKRTVGGADLRFRSAPTDLEVFRFDFMEERLQPLVETSLLADDSLGWLIDDRLERRVDVGVELLLESGGRDPVVVALRSITELETRVKAALSCKAESARAAQFFCEVGK